MEVKSRLVRRWAVMGPRRLACGNGFNHGASERGGSEIARVCVLYGHTPCLQHPKKTKEETARFFFLRPKAHFYIISR